MDDFSQPADFSSEFDQRLLLLIAVIKKTIDILEDDIHELEAILKEMECDVEDLGLMPSEKFKSCPHCCLVMEEMRKKIHLGYLENCLRTCVQ